MPRKKHCDHIIGYNISDYGLADIIMLSNGIDCTVEFYYCPNCGAQLDTVEGLQHRTTGAVRNSTSKDV